MLYEMPLMGHIDEGLNIYANEIDIQRLLKRFKTHLHIRNSISDECVFIFLIYNLLV